MSALATKFHVCQRFSPSSFSSHLTTSHLGRYLIYRTSCDSTQTIAKREILEGSPSGTIIFSECQTRGRGRIDGRSWQSNDKGNIMFTMILRPKTSELFALNLALATAIAAAIQTVCNIRASVKWPNDVWIGNQKIAGILIDADFIGSDIAVAAGVGLNVNEDWNLVEDKTLKSTGTSILTALKNSQSSTTANINNIDRELLLATICNNYEELLGSSFSSILIKYRSYDCLVGNRITVMPKRREDSTSYYSAKAVGFTEEGFLLAQKDNDNQTFPLIAEEVTVRIEQ